MYLLTEELSFKGTPLTQNMVFLFPLACFGLKNFLGNWTLYTHLAQILS